MMVYGRDRSFRMPAKRRKMQPSLWDGFAEKKPNTPYRSDESKPVFPSKLDSFLRTSDSRLAFATLEEREAMREEQRKREALDRDE